MNQSLNSSFLFVAKFILLPAFLVKLLWSISLFYLDKDLNMINNHQNLRFNTQTRLAYKILDISKRVEPKEIVETGKKITDFKLKGTYVSGSDSFVIIEDGSNTEFIYLNEKYQGYMLYHVYENKAIFEKDGEKYELNMYDGKDDNSNNYTQTVHKKHSAKVVASGNYTVPVDIRKEDIDTYTENPEKIWNNIRINDFRTEDGLNFKVSYVRAGSIFSSIGLKPGDVITAIDGEVPQNMGDIMKYYNNINDLTGIVLTVKRNNQEMDLEFRVKE